MPKKKGAHKQHGSPKPKTKGMGKKEDINE